MNLQYIGRGNIHSVFRYFHKYVLTLFAQGVWLSAHIDDLRDSEDMSLDLKAFCGISISELLSRTVKSGMIPMQYI